MAKSRKKPLALIDADGLVYTAVKEAQYLSEVHTEDDEYYEVLDGDACFDGICNNIDNTLADVRAIDCVLCFGSKGNFRKTLNPEYKSNRNNKKPLGYFDMVKRISEQYDVLTWPELEADDLLAILATHPEMTDDRPCVVVSVDKDMKTIPGLYFNPGREHYKDGIQKISVIDAMEFFMTQTMMGDTADGYKGIPGIGKVKAAKILEPFIKQAKKEKRPDYYLFENAVLPAFLEAGLSADDALMNARMARLIQSDEVETNSGGEIIYEMWTPPSMVKEKSSAVRKRRRRNPV